MQGMLRDADLRGHVWLALLYSDGQLPATTLCNAKAVSRWYRDYDLHNVGSMAAIWKRVSSELRSHLGRGEARSSMHMTSRRYILHAS